MIRELVFLCVIASTCCQYPQQRAPPLRQRPPPEEYAEEYAPPPRQTMPQPAPSPNRRMSDLYRPASVHYVNIGAELAGDYKFGYDTGKGNDGQSFREETRLPDGTVKGAYGYVDETGKQRIVKYTAGKEGFNILGDEPEGASRAPAAQPAPQQSYAPQPRPQPAPRPQPQPAYRPAPQPAYRAPPPQPRPAYRAPPAQPQPAYRAPPAQPQPAYRAPPAQSSYASQPRPRPQAPRRRQYAPEPADYDNSQDYDYPNNDIAERRIVPIDTSLFNYNIGTSKKNKK